MMFESSNVLCAIRRYHHSVYPRDYSDEAIRIARGLSPGHTSLYDFYALHCSSKTSRVQPQLLYLACGLGWHLKSSRALLTNQVSESRAKPLTSSLCQGPAVAARLGFCPLLSSSLKLAYLAHPTTPSRWNRVKVLGQCLAIHHSVAD